MRPARLLAAALLAASLAPGLWWREAVDMDRYAPVHIEPLPVQEARAGPLVLERAWRLRSEGSAFGGFSALALREDGVMLALSDSGRMLFLRRDAAGAPAEAFLDRFLRRRGANKSFYDTESLTRDPVTGELWLGSESSNAVTRVSPEFEVERRSRPRLMRGWAGNRGPEAMLRLRDGRFLVLEEGKPGTFADQRRAVLFARDPTRRRSAERGQRFGFPLLGGLAPVDMAELPDGRVLILLRGLPLRLPPRFPLALALADPADIRRGETWPVTILARLDGAMPNDNFEGLAVEPAPGGTAVWLISDDNHMKRWQKTYLLRLFWPHGEL